MYISVLRPALMFKHAKTKELWMYFPCASRWRQMSECVICLCPEAGPQHPPLPPYWIQSNEYLTLPTVGLFPPGSEKKDIFILSFPRVIFWCVVLYR